MQDAVSVAESVEAAQKAFDRTSDVSPETRARWLDSVALALEDNASELVALAERTTHLTSGRLAGEMRRTVFQLRLFAQEIPTGEYLDASIDHADESWPVGPRPDLRRTNVPLGVVGIFGASNFPFAFSVIGGDSVSALAAGCAVVHKIHEAHDKLGERTATVVRDALETADAPDGLFSAVQGRKAGEELVDHPLIQAIGFTGSLRGGKALAARAAARPTPIPFFGELGSINPVFVTAKAWKRRAPEILGDYARSFARDMGQLCTKPGLMFVPTEDASLLQASLQASLSDIGSTPMLTEQLGEGYERALAELRGTAGVRVLVAGRSGATPTPTVVLVSADTVGQAPWILAHEVFGPATVVVTYQSQTELAALATLLQGQLTATVQAEPDDDIDDLMTILGQKAGRIILNGWPTGVSVTYAQHHGGPYPATTSPLHTSVGTSAIKRFVRPLAFQSFPEHLLPPSLKDENPWRISRRIDGRWMPALAG